MNKYVRFLPLLLLVAWATGCDLNSQFKGNPLAWIDRPLDGSTLPLQPFEVMAHASDPNGVSQFETSIDFLPNWQGDSAGAAVSASDQGAITACLLAHVNPPGIRVGLSLSNFTCTPDQAGYYLVRVRAMNSAGVWGDYAAVAVHIGVPVVSPTLTVPPLPTSTATPSPSPAITLITFTPIRNVNCRYGPGQVYDILDSILSGNRLPVEGRNEDKTWVYVRLQRNGCWIGLSNGTLNGDINQVPFHPYPPPLTETPTPVLGCYQYDANQQLVCVAPCSPNAQPGGACTP